MFKPLITAQTVTLHFIQIHYIKRYFNDIKLLFNQFLLYSQLFQIRINQEMLQSLTQRIILNFLKTFNVTDHARATRSIF